MENQRRGCFFYRFVAAFLLLFLLVFQTIAYGAPERQLVRVGFFPMSGFHEYDAYGMPTGYDVDYLNTIKRYTHWDFEFVQMDSWDDALIALNKGEIDLLGSAQLTPKRAAQFQYCVFASGNTYSALVAKKSDVDMVYEDFEAFDGIQVGMVRTFIRHSEFVDYQQENAFSVHTYFYNNTQELHQALEEGEVDAIVMSAMELNRNEKIIGKFAQAPFYYITSHNNNKLMTQLNKASERLEIERPGFCKQMEEKYFPHLSQTPLSKKELDFIERSPVIIASSLEEYYPVSYIEDGVIKGIIPDIIRYFGKESGLHFLLKPLPQDVGVAQYAASGNTDMVVCAPFTSQNMQNSDINITTPFYKTNVVFAGLSGTAFVPTNPLKVAIPETRQSHKEYIQQNYPHFTIVAFSDTAACLDAVKEGWADITMQDAYVLDEYLQGIRYNMISVMPTGMWEEEFSIALPKDVNPLLTSILNKEIARLPRETVNRIVLQYTMAKPYQITWRDVLVQFQTYIWTGVGFILLCIIFFGMLRYEKRKNLKLILKNQSTITHLANTINSGVLTLNKDEDYTILYANQGFFSLLGKNSRPEEGKPLGQCVSYIYEEDLQEFRRKMGQKYTTGDTVQLDIRLIGGGGKVVPVSFQATFVAKGKLENRFYCIVVDISSQRKLIDALELEKERYRILIEQSDDIMFDYDTETQQVTCSHKFYEKFGWEVSKLRESTAVKDIVGVHPKDLKALRELKQDLMEKHSGNCNVRILKKNGEYIWCSLYVFIISKGGKHRKLVGKLTDIDEQIQERQRLEQMSKRDQLTRLYHKEAFQMIVEERLANRGKHKYGALMFVDLDYFKDINDRLGHLAGDVALRDATRILKENTTSEDVISRFGGDEFCVYLEKGTAEAISQTAERICRNLRMQYQNGDKKANVSASIGVYFLQDEDTSYQEALAKADAALYEAKNNGRNTFVFYHNINHNSHQ